VTGPIDWGLMAFQAVSALAGGFLGGWIVAFRMGRWRQRVEDRLDTIDVRLDKGGKQVDAVPILKTRMDIMLDEIRAMRVEMRDALQQCVTEPVCRERCRGNAR